MTQQNNTPEDPRDSSEDFTRPLTQQDEVSQSYENSTESADYTKPLNDYSAPSNGSVSSTQTPPSQGNFGQQSGYGQQNYGQNYSQSGSNYPQQNSQPNSYGQQSYNQQSSYAGASAGSGAAGANAGGAGGYGAYPATNGTNGYGNSNYGSGQPPYNYNSAGYNTNGSPYGGNGASPKPGANILGIIALISSGIGLILGCIPVIFFVGWVLLFAGFVMGIIALVQKNKSKWAGVTAIIVSVLGSIISFVVVFIMIIASASNSISSEPWEDPSPSSAVTGSSTGNIGDTYDWGDGVKVTISQPTEFNPSNTASAKDDPELQDFQKYTVTITNDSSTAFEPSFYMNGMSGGQEIDRVFDSAQDITSAPTTRIQPGDSSTFDVVFAMADHEDASFDVTVDYDHDMVTFVQN